MSVIFFFFFAFVYKTIEDNSIKVYFKWKKILKNNPVCNSVFYKIETNY